MGDCIGCDGTCADVTKTLAEVAPLPPKKDERPYRFRVREGDVVRIPGGQEALVTEVEIIEGGHIKVAKVKPIEGNLVWNFILGAFGQYEFAEDEIDNLIFLGYPCETCNRKATWVRETQFSGDHRFCDEHARGQSDFGSSDPSYFTWKKV